MVEITPSQRLTSLLDGSPLKPIQRWLWLLSTGGTLLDGFVIFVLGVAMPLIIAEFHLASDTVGLIVQACCLVPSLARDSAGSSSWNLVRSTIRVIRVQAIGFASMAFGMLLLMIAVQLSNSILHIPLVFAGFVVFNLLFSTTFTLAPAPISDAIARYRQRFRRRRSQNRSDSRCFRPANLERQVRRPSSPRNDGSGKCPRL